MSKVLYIIYIIIYRGGIKKPRKIEVENLFFVIFAFVKQKIIIFQKNTKNY